MRHNTCAARSPWGNERPLRRRPIQSRGRIKPRLSPMLFLSPSFNPLPGTAGKRSACVSGSEGHAHTEKAARTRQARRSHARRFRQKHTPGARPYAKRTKRGAPVENRTILQPRPPAASRRKASASPPPRRPCLIRGFGGDYLPRRGLGRSPGAFPGVRGSAPPAFPLFLPFLSPGCRGQGIKKAPSSEGALCVTRSQAVR